MVLFSYISIPQVNNDGSIDYIMISIDEYILKEKLANMKIT
jgi:hypothetical protein